jgi:hypothetical protein
MNINRREELKLRNNLQEQSDKLYLMLELLAANEERTIMEQSYIETLISVLKSLPTIKPIEFTNFS